MKHQIFYVEDDVNLAFVTKDNLEMAGYVVNWFADGQTAVDRFKEETYDLCLLDVMLPKIDGFEIAERLRAVNQEVPILFLTAKSMKEDRIKGFKKGGDDYITKPFSMEELLLRIQVFISRKSKSSNMPSNKLGAFVFDKENLKLIHPDSTRKLTAREAEILSILVLNQSRVVKREEILVAIWGDDDYFKGRSLDVFISKLRKYLKHDSEVEIINHHGVGFKLNLP